MNIYVYGKPISPLLDAPEAGLVSRPGNASRTYGNPPQRIENLMILLQGVLVNSFLQLMFSYTHHFKEFMQLNNYPAYKPLTSPGSTVKFLFS